MVALPAVPDGFSCRALTLADAHQVAQLVRSDEIDLMGTASIIEEEIVSAWQRPSFDLAAESVGVVDGDGRLAAYGEVFKGERAEVTVRPELRGRRLGTALMHWTWQQAAAKGSPLIGQTVPALHAAARSLLAANGYRERWTSWVLERALDGDEQPVVLPPGHRIRPFDPVEERAFFTVIDDAFNEWPGRQPAVIEDWVAMTTGRDDAQPWLFQVLVDPADVIVGAMVMALDEDAGWVDQLAVRADRRGEGLARALLNTAFAEFRAHGFRTARLSTDSRTGALGLYLHVGMTVTQEWISLAKHFELQPG